LFAVVQFHAKKSSAGKVSLPVLASDEAAVWGLVGTSTEVSAKVASCTGFVDASVLESLPAVKACLRMRSSLVTWSS
jgi:hypothetical protein